jgi:hypothetical protein
MSDASRGDDRVPTRTSGSAVLVAQHFLPLNVVASQRALRMARILLSRFDRVYVVSDDPSNADPALLDHQYGSEVLADPRLVRIAVRPILTGYGYGVAAPSGVQRLVGGVATRLLCGPGADWIWPLRRAFARLATGQRIRVVVATGAPFITFGAAVKFGASHTAPVLLDYRDLWTSNPHAPYPTVARSLVNRWLERPLNQAATLITTVSEGCRTSLVAESGNTPVRVLYNTPDSEYLDFYRQVVADWQHRQVTAGDHAKARVRVVFTGQIYGHCTFAPFLKAIARLPTETIDRIETHYYGDGSGIARTEFQQFGLSRILVDHGKVSKTDSLRAMLDADLLLSLIHTDRMSSDPAVTGHMSTKIYDYFLSGAPILNIGPVNAEINALAATIGHPAFHNAPADDTAAISAVVRDAVGRRHKPAQPLSVALPRFDVAFSKIVGEVVPV